MTGNRRREDYRAGLISVLSGLILGVVTASGVGAQPLAPDFAPGSRPNIVVIMTDDLDERMFKIALNVGFMPRVKALFVQTGVKVENSFVTNSLCCPSRATFLTGQYTHNHGTEAFDDFNDASTLATALKEAGYFTGFVGKYLNGYTGRHDDNGNGVIDADETRYVPPGWHYWQGLRDWTTYFVYDYYLINGWTDQTEYYPDTYRTDTVAAKALEFLRLAETVDDDKPFFLWLTPVIPHSERGYGQPACILSAEQKLYTIRPKPEYVGSASGVAMPRLPSFNEPNIVDKPEWLSLVQPVQFGSANADCIESVYRDKLESLQAIDVLVSQVVNALRDKGEENTILVFTSDNGFQFGEHRLIKKTYAYEESIRVPLYFRDLAQATPAVVLSQTVLNNDLAPTFAELAGATIGHVVDGRSILPLLASPPPATWHTRFFVEHFNKEPVPDYVALRDMSDNAPSLYVEYRLPDGTWQGCVPGYCEFYDMASDPLELMSQHENSAFAARIQAAESLVSSFRSCTGADCRALEDSSN